MKWISVASLALVIFCGCEVAVASVDTLDTDLNSLIDAAAASKNQFAVDIEHPVSGVNAWTYSVRVPAAVSMSFHASKVSLPGDAVLTVSAGTTTSVYRAHDITRGGIWGRPLLGDTLTFTLSGDAASIHIQSFQAGYRAIAGVATDNAHYARIKQLAAAGCTQNYSCNATEENQSPAHATVAAVVGNQYQCTGTLLNNTSNDAAPYVLTARHCENGKMGGGNPDAADAVTVYWDAVTACGSALGSIYEGTVLTQSGAVTVVEQQDAWLIRLNSAPAASDAYFAGWDATGGVFTGGYSIHHALGNDRQYVGWSGQASYEHWARATVGVNYESTFWSLANGIGNVGAGSSGSAVYDPANRVVGSGTLAKLAAGENTAGVCPVPGNSSATAQYTALSGVWTSTADATSSTGNRTLQSVLDPNNTGKMVVDGFASTPIALHADTSFLRTDQQLTLWWDVPGALSCTASGGQSRDGWAGARAGSGSVQVNASAGGHVVYGLSCTTSNGVGHADAAADWTYVKPGVGSSGSQGAPATAPADAAPVDTGAATPPAATSTSTDRGTGSGGGSTAGSGGTTAGGGSGTTAGGGGGTGASNGASAGGTAAGSSAGGSANGGGGALDLFWLSVLSALWRFKARANPALPVVARHEWRAASRRSSRLPPR